MGAGVGDGDGWGVDCGGAAVAVATGGATGAGVGAAVAGAGLGAGAVEGAGVLALEAERTALRATAGTAGGGVAAGVLSGSSGRIGPAGPLRAVGGVARYGAVGRMAGPEMWTASTTPAPTASAIDARMSRRLIGMTLPPPSVPAPATTGSLSRGRFYRRTLRWAGSSSRTPSTPQATFSMSPSIVSSSCSSRAAMTWPRASRVAAR